MDIVGKIELISESGTLLSMGNIIAIIVAVISLTGVIISTVWTNRTTIKITLNCRKNGIKKILMQT